MAEQTGKHTHRPFTLVERINALVARSRASFLKGKVVEPVLHTDQKTPYPVTYGYGVKSSAYEAGYHTGEDHSCPEGSLAVATTYGHVAYAGWGGAKWGAAYGNQVVITTGDGKYDYAHNHLSKILVKTGDKVWPGLIVGNTGATGNVTGPHDHFEARTAGGHYGTDVPPILVKAKLAKK